MSKLIPIDQIQVGERHRAELGDIDALAASIANCGLLHPPVITSTNLLVCGFRRLEALKRLGRTTVEASVIDPADLLQAEHDENELRKAFTDSERVALGKALEALIGSRQGQRTDQVETTQPVANLPQAEPGSGASSSPLVGKIPQVAPGQKTREVVAKAVGYGNEKTYRQAKRVVDNGVPALVDAMDRGEVSKPDAALMATLPPAEQATLVANGPVAVKAKAEEVRLQRAEKTATTVPPKVNRRSKRSAMDRLIENVVNLLQCVDSEDIAPAAPGLPVAPGGGGIAHVAGQLTPRQRQDARQQLSYIVERLQGWIDHLDQIGGHTP
jgi:ParB-like nuclease domain